MKKFMKCISKIFSLSWLIVFVFASSVNADTILNTQSVGSGYLNLSNYSSGNRSFYQALAQEFYSGNINTLTDFTAYGTSNSGVSSVTWQLEADNSGVPSNTSLYSVDISLDQNSTWNATSLDWTLATDTNYWLVALPDVGTNAGWFIAPNGLSVPDSYGSSGSKSGYKWGDSGLAQQVVINGVLATTSVPEPSSTTLLAFGLAGYAALRKRMRG